MNFSLFFAYILTLISLALAFQWFGKRDETTTTSTRKPSPTSVYITITTNGELVVKKTLYEQKFMTTFTATTSSVKAGSIGLGSLSGTVGQISRYQMTTVLNEAPALAYSGGLGVVAVLAQLLL